MEDAVGAENPVFQGTNSSCVVILAFTLDEFAQFVQLASGSNLAQQIENASLSVKR
jgi:hypothetical protein